MYKKNNAFLTWRLFVLIALMFFTLSFLENGNAEVLPTLEGDVELSDAPCELQVSECLRVDITFYDNVGAWVNLIFPDLPHGIVGALLFDGWNVIHADLTYIKNDTLRLCFSPEDLARLDGTVGIYLIILTEIGGD